MPIVKLMKNILLRSSILHTTSSASNCNGAKEGNGINSMLLLFVKMVVQQWAKQTSQDERINNRSDCVSTAIYIYLDNLYVSGECIMYDDGNGVHSMV